MVLVSISITPILAQSVSGPAGTYYWYRDHGKDRGHLNLSNGRVWIFTWSAIDDSSIVQGTSSKACQIFIQDRGSGSGWETIGIQIHIDFYGSGGHLLQFYTVLPSDSWSWIVRSSHGFNPGDITAQYDLKIVLWKNLDGSYTVEPYFNIGNGWELFYDGSWTSGTPGDPGSLDLTQSCAGIQIEGGSDGILSFSPKAPAKPYMY
ncbi:MAG: hypothetical protein L6N94_02225 [Candidatus Methylarchaceae archaeon HK01M]|nr:hypothetical protein [Candidatus Methylarchaceae archaeon HK01M]